MALCFSGLAVFTRVSQVLKNLYFIRASTLARRIQAGDVDSLTMLKHFIVFSILFSSGFSLPLSFKGVPADAPGWATMILEFITQGAINYIGIRYTYHINKNGDGQDYLPRLFCLALPVTLQLTLVFILVSVLWVTVITRVFADNPAAIERVMWVFFRVVGFTYPALFYYRIGQLLRVCRGAA